MGSEIIEYEQAFVQQYRGNYVLTVPGVSQNQYTLKRDEDFGLIRNKKGEATVKKPVLFKSGAERVFQAYGVFADYITETAIERVDKDPLFYYRIKCELYTYNKDGQKVVVAAGVGSANTAEKRNGFNGPFDAANGSLKMARKRAAVDAAINLACLSGMFSQDQENEDFMEKSNNLTLRDDSNITSAQLKRLFAIGAEAGLTPTEIKNKIVAAGFSSTKDIKQKDYNAVCDILQNERKTSTPNPGDAGK